MEQQEIILVPLYGFSFFMSHGLVCVDQVDDFDVFKERMLGSGDTKPRPHKRALLFVDNSGADVVLGMLPLARELLRRGTEVGLHSA